MCHNTFALTAVYNASFSSGKFVNTVLSLEARGACRDSAVFCNHCIVFWSFFKTSSTRKVKLSLLWVIKIWCNLLSPNLHTTCAGLQVMQRILLRAEFCMLADVEACSAVWNGNTDLMPFQPWTDIVCFCPKLLRSGDSTAISIAAKSQIWSTPGQRVVSEWSLSNGSQRIS